MPFSNIYKKTRHSAQSFPSCRASRVATDLLKELVVDQEA